MNRKNIVIYNVLILFNLYFFIAVCFSVIYIVLTMLKLGHIVDHYASAAHQNQFIDLVSRSLYFSYITLFAVGYGDMTPLGLSKAVSMIQAFVGFILPYAIMLKYLIYKPRFLKHHSKK
ncbi:ion channel [Sedimentibacter sp.]|uniref:ion channel n=1 Tax=Sedimentibacter sp. TaxID=1960295 RepID=UPI002897641D|nr:ion channel [Sedimentibacter sp.]